MMKILLLFLLTPNLLMANRVDINLDPVKSEFYHEIKEIGYLGYNTRPGKHIFVIANDVSKIKSEIYTINRDKSFFILTESLIEGLKRYKFKNAKYIHFAFYDTSSKKYYEDNILRVKISDLKKFDNRDFSLNDKDTIKSKYIKKYKLLPLRFLFSNAVIVKEKNFIKSKELTDQYKKFIDEYTFKSVGNFEFDIENNREKINELKNSIHIYCINGDYNKVKLYIDLGFNVNEKDVENNQTLLEYASVNGNYNIVKLLINHGANPNTFKKGYENSYLAAKRAGFTKIAELLKPITKELLRPVIKTTNAGTLTRESWADSDDLNILYYGFACNGKGFGVVGLGEGKIDVVGLGSCDKYYHNHSISKAATEACNCYST